MTLLGSFAVNINGEPITQFRSDKVRALLVYLALEPSQPHRRRSVADLLWPEVGDKQALESLRTALYQLRQSLDGASPGLSRQLLTATRQTIQFNTEAEVTLQTDVVYFQTLLAACEAHPHDQLARCSTCLERLSQAAHRYRGELLTGFSLTDAPPFEEWLLLQREMLNQQALLTFKTLADGYEARRGYDRAYAYASRLLKLDSYREASHRQLMRLLAYRGLPDQALAQFAACRHLLRDELGTALEAETVALAEQIRHGELSRDVEAKQQPSPRPSPFGRGSQTSPPLGPVLSEVEGENEGGQPTPPLDWSEIPLVGTFFGRTAELAQLQGWLLKERCRLVTVLGMGGLGKTALAAQVARDVTAEFEAVIWRSLLNAPTLDELLPGMLQTLNGVPLVEYPDSLAEKLSLFLEHLRHKRSLLVLDNLETILQSDLAGQYRPGYEAYGQLIETVARHEHQSCLLLTSREQPQNRRFSHSNLPGVCTLSLTGLDLAAGHQILQAHGVSVADAQAERLTSDYSGNPLALNLLAQTIQDFYFGDVAAFLGEEMPVFDDIRQVLDEQFNRLSPLEQDILLWLAVAREPLRPSDLSNALIRSVRQRELLQTLRSLERRSLLERSETGFMLQNVVTEYLTDRLIEQVSREFESGDLKWLNSHALLQAQAKTYVRHSQTRLILQPIAERLTTSLGLAGIDQTCRHMLDELRQSPLAPGYAAGNLLNLLLHLKIDLTGYNFSRLSVWQANLQSHLLSEVNFSGAGLRGTVFTDVFGFIYTVAFSPDGQLLAAGAADGRIRLWSVATDQPIALLQGHSQAVWSLAFSPDGRTLASAGAEDVIVLWDVSRRQVVSQLTGHRAGIQGVTFSPDGRTLASGGRDETVRLWDVASGQLRQVLTGHTDNVQAVMFSPKGHILASGSRDGMVRLWDAASGTIIQTLRGHSSWVNAVAFSPTGQTLATAGEDGAVCLWAVAAAMASMEANVEPRQILSDHTAGVQAVAFSPDGERLVSGSNDHTVRVWEADTGQLSQILKGHSNWVRAVAFSPDGRTLASGSWDHTVRLWDINRPGGQLLLTFHGYSNMVPAVVFSPDGKTLVSAHTDNLVRLWDIDTGHLRRTLSGHQNWVWHVTFSSDGQSIASGSYDQTIRLWDADTGQVRQTLRGHQGGVQVVAFSPDGQILASSGLDHNIQIWDIASGQCLQILKKHRNWINSVAFSPDGQTLASGSADQSIILWDVSTGQVRRVLSGHERGIQNVCFSPDGRLLATASWDRTVRLWDVFSGECVRILAGHTDLAQGVAFSPDGKTVASSSYDQTVRLWAVESGRLIRMLEGHTHWVLHTAFSPDGQMLASGSGDKTIKLWNWHTGECLRTLHAPGPYAGMNISGVTGITEAQRSALKALGAVDGV